MKLRWPIASHNIAKVHEGRVVRNHGGHKSGVVNSGPMLYGIPFMASAGQLIFGWVYPTILGVITKFRIVGGKWKRNVNSFLLDRLFLVETILEVNHLPVVVDGNFQSNCGRVGSRGFRGDDGSNRRG